MSQRRVLVTREVSLPPYACVCVKAGALWSFEQPISERHTLVLAAERRQGKNRWAWQVSLYVTKTATFVRYLGKSFTAVGNLKQAQAAAEDFATAWLHEETEGGR